MYYSYGPACSCRCATDLFTSEPTRPDMYVIRHLHIRELIHERSMNKNSSSYSIDTPRDAMCKRLCEGFTELYAAAT